MVYFGVITSLGCTVVEMLTGKPPLSHLEPAAAMFRIGSKPIEPTLPENVSLDAKEFVKAALTWKPDERPWSDDLQHYKFVSKVSFSLGECIGAGAFGQVFKCRFLDQGSTTLLAVKRVKLKCQYTGVNGEVKALQNAISNLQKVKHERIVSYCGSQQIGGYLHLFMEFMPGGSLSDRIRRSKNRVLSEYESSGYTKQMLEGVTFLHSQNITHRDIKGSNVLLDGKGNVKLADFELSKTIQKIGSETALKSARDTLYYMVPEIFGGQGYGREADIWSVGCTVIEMLTGKSPLSYLQTEVARSKLASGPIDIMTLVRLNVSQDAREFIVAALKWNPRQRPSSPELQRYAFVANWCSETSI